MSIRASRPEGTSRPQVLTPGQHKSDPVQRFLNLGIHLFGLFPLARWFLLGYQANLTANPQEFLIRSSGIWALVLLWVTLSVTPIRRIIGWGGGFAPVLPDTESPLG